MKLCVKNKNGASRSTSSPMCVANEILSFATFENPGRRVCVYMLYICFIVSARNVLAEWEWIGARCIEGTFTIERGGALRPHACRSPTRKEWNKLSAANKLLGCASVVCVLWNGLLLLWKPYDFVFAESVNENQTTDKIQQKTFPLRNISVPHSVLCVCAFFSSLFPFIRCITTNFIQRTYTHTHKFRYETFILCKNWMVGLSAYTDLAGKLIRPISTAILNRL